MVARLFSVLTRAVGAVAACCTCRVLDLQGLDVVVLDLSKNLLRYLVSGTFSGLRVTTLNLQSNSIRHVGTWAFGTPQHAGALLLMRGNPTECTFDAAGAAFCRCGGLPAASFANAARGCGACRPLEIRTSALITLAASDAREDPGTGTAESFQKQTVPYSTTGSSDYSTTPASTAAPVDPGITAVARCHADANGDGQYGVGHACDIGCPLDYVEMPVRYTCSVAEDGTPVFLPAGHTVLPDDPPQPICIKFGFTMLYNQTWGNTTNTTDGTPRELLLGPKQSLFNFSNSTVGANFSTGIAVVYRSNWDDLAGNGGISVVYENTTAMPPGMSLTEDGQLYGSPSEYGVYRIAIMARTKNNEGMAISESQPVWFTVSVAPPMAFVRQRISMLGHVDRLFTYGEQFAVQGGNPPYKAVSSPVPRGVVTVANPPGLRGYPAETGLWERVQVEIVDQSGARLELPEIDITVEDSIGSLKEQLLVYQGLFFCTIVLSLVLCLVLLVARRQGRTLTEKEKLRHVRAALLGDDGGGRATQRWPWSRSTRAGAAGSHGNHYGARGRDYAFVQEAQAESVEAANYGGGVFSSLTNPGPGAQQALGGLAQLPHGQCTVCTRIFRRESHAPLPADFLGALALFIGKAAAYSNRVLVAAPNEDTALCDAIVLLGSTTTAVEVCLVPVSFWGKFTPPLNTLLSRAAQHDDTPFLLFQSIEVLAEPAAIATLLSHMDSSTLVVGLSLRGAHWFLEGEQDLNGLTCPWNTVSVWNVSRLGLTGFLPVADANGPHLEAGDAGVEEVTAIALQQTLFGKDNAKAKLVRVPSSWYTWNVEQHSRERLQKHRKKMMSKLIRPRKQMAVLGTIASGKVVHITAAKESSKLPRKGSQSPGPVPVPPRPEQPEAGERTPTTQSPTFRSSDACYLEVGQDAHGLSAVCAAQTPDRMDVVSYKNFTPL